MARVRQWLSVRQALSDWVTDTKTESENRVSLEKQSSGFSAHPLAMGQPQRLGIGLQRFNDVPGSRLPKAEFLTGGALTAVNLDDLDEIGYQRPLAGPSSRLPLHDVREPNLWDLLATEGGAPLCTQDGEPIGMA